MAECTMRERRHTCHLCISEVKTNGASLCSAGKRPGRLPWPHWRDEDPELTMPEVVKPVSVESNKNVITLAHQLTEYQGLVQHLRNEVAELKTKQNRSKSAF